MHASTLETLTQPPALNEYLGRLPNRRNERQAFWRGASGQVAARYFNCTLTSAFAPVVDLRSRNVVAHQAYVRCDEANGLGASPWNLFSLAANDDQLVSLDRLCRTLHVLNYFSRHGKTTPLFLHVHPRLLQAVESDHGATFRRVLASLDINPQRVVLDLPETVLHDGRRAANIVASYRLNGFRVGLNVSDIDGALHALSGVKTDFISIDIARRESIAATRGHLLAEDTQLLVKRLEDEHHIAPLLEKGVSLGQGYLFGPPAPLHRDA